MRNAYHGSTFNPTVSKSLDEAAFVDIQTSSIKGVLGWDSTNDSLAYLDTSGTKHYIATTTGTEGGMSDILAAAEVGWTVTATAHTARIVDITTSIANTSVNLFNIASTMSTAFSTAKTLKGINLSITSGAADVDNAIYIGNDVALVSTALSKADLTGYRVIHSGTASGAAGTQNYIGFDVAPTITLNGTTNLYGLNVDFTGITSTASNDIYAIRVVTSNKADACAFFGDATRTLYICDNSVAIYATDGGGGIVTTCGGNAIDVSGTLTGHGIYIHPTSIAASKRALRIGDYGTEIPVDGGEGLIRTYAKTTTGTGATALQFHWGYVTSTANLIGSQSQYEVQTTVTGPTSIMGSDIIVGVSATGLLADSATVGEGLIGQRVKIYGSGGTVTGHAVTLWLDNQINVVTPGRTEASILGTTGGSKPDTFIWLNTTSGGWGQFLYLDSTMAAQEPFVATGCSVTVASVPYLKVLVNSTQYGIPLIAI